jgi:two-component system sensor histidine kinase/response regulator
MFPVPVPILVVDDNAAKRLALKAVLTPLGFPVVEADSGFAALRCVMAEDFAVILLDVCMPIMDGFETAGLIRQRKQSEMTPIIFITAFGSDEIMNADRYAEGAVDFIFAPVEPDELRAKVSVFANLFIKASVLASQAREVKTSADQLRLLTDAAPIGIFQTDVENKYVYTNPRWSEITGITSNDAAGREWDTLIGSGSAEGVSASDSVAHLPDFCSRFEILRPGSASRIVLVTSVSIPDTDGGTTGWVGTVADVTAEAGAEAAMSKARDEATAASRLKSDFLTNMSHEIRTPMNGVIGMTDLLLETNLDDRQRDYAQTVRNSGEALLAIINDILDFSRIEAGKLEIEDIEFSVRTIVDGVMDLLAPGAQAKGLELLALIERSVPAVVSGDPGRLRQVLTNLIGNAIKFTQAGEIVVRAAAVESSGGDSIIRFEVSDTGDGIEPEKIGVIFQSFVQADTSTSRKYGGTGLGLSISSQLTALMGGDCGVSSQLGTGSTFWFTICVHARRESDVLAAPDASLDGVTVLIVDDNATQRSVLSEYLTDWGMRVTGVDSSDAAMETLRAAAGSDGRFSLALLDRTMAGMEGLELRDAILDDPVLTTRLVLMTDLAGDGDNGSEVHSDVCTYLSKPIHQQALLASVRVALGLQTADVGPTETSASAVSAAGHGEPGRILLAEDNLINQRVVVAMLRTAGYKVDTVLNGAAAVEAFASQPYDAILMDCQMPELNGYEATAAIRAREHGGRRTPIIAVTAGARSEDRERCLSVGMDGYLAKPLNKDALLALVAREVNNGAAMSVGAQIEGETAEAEHTLDLVVFGELRALGDFQKGDFLADLVGQFVSDTEPRLAELREALAVGHAATVGRIAHSIEGSGGQLGGRRFALSCSRLQAAAEAGQLAGDETDLDEVETEYHKLCGALKLQLASADHERRRAAHG